MKVNWDQFSIEAIGISHLFRLSFRTNWDEIDPNGLYATN